MHVLLASHYVCAAAHALRSVLSVVGSDSDESAARLPAFLQTCMHAPRCMQQDTGHTHAAPELLSPTHHALLLCPSWGSSLLTLACTCTYPSLLAAHKLIIPRRPAWDETTTPDQLDAQEKASFLNWRRYSTQQQLA